MTVIPTPTTPVAPTSTRPTRTIPAPTGAVVQVLAEVLARTAPAVQAVRSVLGAIGVSAKVAAAVLYMVQRGAKGAQATGQAMAATLRAEAAYRAAYLAHGSVRVQNAVNAGKSLDQAVADEMRFYRMHLQAQENRRRAAAVVDRVARPVDMQAAYGPAAPPGEGGTVMLAGWRARLDLRTSPECRAADGCNFRVDVPPVIGYPGTVHLHCRCVPVAPYKGAPVLDALTPAMPHR